MENPFRYGKEVKGYQFFDREEAVEELYGHLRDGTTNVVLYAPRRYGKTSLVLRVLERFQLEKTRCLHFDMSKVASLEKFCEAYSAAVYSLFGGLPDLANKITSYLVHLHPTFSLSSKGATVRFDYGDRMTETSVAEVLDLPERLAKEAGLKAVMIAFDEFQEVAALTKDMPMEAVFRSVIQSHQIVRYVFLGSKTHLMRRMFGAASRPFYKSALTMKIGKPPAAESEAFVVSRYEAEGIAIGANEVKAILEVSENIPYYLQAVAGLAFRSVERRKGQAVEPADIDFAVRRLDEAGEDLYEEMLSNLSAAQRALVEALAEEPTDKFDEAYRVRHALGNASTIHSARRELIRRGIVETDKARSFVGDPFFARYIRNASAARILI